MSVRRRPISRARLGTPDVIKDLEDRYDLAEIDQSSRADYSYVTF
jgi:hypothetical protein